MLNVGLGYETTYSKGLEINKMTNMETIKLDKLYKRSRKICINRRR